MPDPRVGPIQFASISRNTSGDGSAIVAGVAGKAIRLVGYVLQAPATPALCFLKGGSGATAPALSKALPVPVAPSSILVLPEAGPWVGAGELASDGPAGAGLFLNLDSAVQINGVVLYQLI